MAHTINQSSLSTETADTTKTHSFNCGTGATVLIISIWLNGNTARTGGAPTFNGVPMTDSGRGAVSNIETGVEVWYLLNPTTGAAYNISVPNSGAELILISASSWNAGSGKVSALDSADHVTGTTADPSLNAYASIAGNVMYATLGHGYRNRGTANDNEINSFDGGNLHWGDQYYISTSAGNRLMGWTTNADDWEIIVMTIKEVDAPTGWAHKIMGVASASISKVDTVTKANISKIAGT